MLNNISPVSIGNVGTLSGLAGSIASLSVSSPQNSRLIFCDVSQVIPEVPGAVTVEIITIGAGGGGGSGCLNTTSLGAAGGGGGGGNGGFAAGTYAVAGLVFPLIAVVGAGGIGGASVTGTTAAGNSGGSGGQTSVLASGVVGSNGIRKITPNTLVTLMAGNGGGGGAGGGTNAGGTAGSGGNTNLESHFSHLGNPGALAGGYPTPLTVADGNLANWVIPRGGAGGGGFANGSDALYNGGFRHNTSRGWFWSPVSSEITNGQDSPAFPYLIGGGYGAAGGGSSLTNGGAGGNGWRGAGGGGGGAGRVTSGAGGNGGNGCAILIFR